MSEPLPPAWVRRADGRLEPFDADRIARSLFDAAQCVGQADAFLCRELTDGVVHFLAQECEATPSVVEIAEVVARTVRELGYPALARAYEQRGPRCELPSPNSPYSADVQAANAQQLIQLDLSCADDRLAALLCTPERLQAAATLARRLAIEGVEEQGLMPPLAPVGVAVRLHLNMPTALQTSEAGGLLFAPEPTMPLAERRARSLAWLEGSPQGIDWHLGAEDVDDPGWLESVCDRALDPSRDVAFVFDRPRRAVALGGGLTRSRPAVLIHVGIHLLTLAEQPGMLADPERYLQRLGSLLRLALSAAVQRRQQLRGGERPGLREGFLLERAIVVIEVLHLDEVVRRFTGWSLANGGASLALGRRIVRRLLEVLRSEGRHLQLEGVLEGLTPLAAGASLRAQASAASALHALAEGGTLRLHWPEEIACQPDRLAEELRRQWRETAVGRVEIIRKNTTGRKDCSPRPAVPPIPPDGPS
ncbi:MAG: ATP cone domain-containing protein [Gemmataceae bacterium]